MTAEAAEFYSRGAEEFQERHSLDRVSEGYVRAMEGFSSRMEGKVLDAGCAAGRDLNYFERKGLEAVGIDLSENMVEVASEKTECRVMKADIRDLPFEDKSFYGVWCNLLLHLFDGRERLKSLREINRVLRSDGLLFLGLKRGKGSFKREKYGSEIEQNLLSESRARKELEETGFKVQDIEINETDEEFDYMNILSRRMGDARDD
ncbi:MAG: class I SAM-dependent methyltransferase [Candidatus Nanohaloarchaea archaeon]